MLLVVRRNGSVVEWRNVALEDSRFRHVFTPSRTGRYTFVGGRAADIDHFGGTSPTLTIRVVR